jgi:hypothetical protein
MDVQHAGDGLDPVVRGVGAENLPADVSRKRPMGAPPRIPRGPFAAARTVYKLTKTPYTSAVLRNASEDLAQRYGRTKKAKAPSGSTPVQPAKPVTPPAPEPSPAPPKA